MLNSNDIAWAAGLFEGEGCIFIANEFDKRDSKYRTRSRLVLEMTDKDIVERFKTIVGGNIYGPIQKKGKDHWKPTWRWTVTSKSQVKNILLIFLPYLGERRTEKAKEILKEIELRHYLITTGKNA